VSSMSFALSALRVTRGWGEYNKVQVTPSWFTGKQILRIHKRFLSGLTSATPDYFCLPSPRTWLAVPPKSTSAYHAHEVALRREMNKENRGATLITSAYPAHKVARRSSFSLHSV